MRYSFWSRPLSAYSIQEAVSYAASEEGLELVGEEEKYHITVYVTGAKNESYDPEDPNRDFEVWGDQVYSEFDVTPGDFFSMTTYGHFENADPHYYFAGWALENGEPFDDDCYYPTGDMSVYVYWKEAWAVTLDADGGIFTRFGTERYTAAVAKGEQCWNNSISGDVSRDGLALAGWYIDDGSADPVVYDTLTQIYPESDCTVKAKWIEGKKLTLNMNGGLCGTEALPEVTLYAAPGKTLQDYVWTWWIRKGTTDENGDYIEWERAGWSLTPDGEPFAERDYIVENDATLYVIWKRVCDIYYMPVDGYFPGWEVGFDMHTTLDYGERIWEHAMSDLPSHEDPEKAFAAWYKDSDRTIPLTPDDVITGTTILYAGYGPCYMVTLDANGGCFYDEPGNTAQTVKVGRGLSVNTSYWIKKGEAWCTGWALDPAGTQPVALDNWMYVPEENVTLYAIWSDNGNDDPDPTEAPDPTDAPDPTEAPDPTDVPDPTVTPSPAVNPTVTPTPTDPDPTDPPAPACVHSYSWVQRKAPTCITAGTQELVCSKCGAISETKTIPATGSHSYGAWTVTKAATCGAAGTKKRTCKVCGHAETATIAKLSTGHSYGAWTTTKAATCAASGSKKRTCKVCGHAETAVIAKLTTHSYGAWTTKAATCTAAGSKKRTCKYCGKTETQILKALGHNFVASPQITATCAREGKKGGNHCSRCGKVGAPQITVPKLKTHTYGSWTTTRTATVFRTGEQTRTCKYCGKKETRTIKKLTPKVTLNKTSVTLLKGKYAAESVTVKATGLLGADSVKSWSSSKPSVASVNGSGKITAKKAGTTTITVTTQAGAKDTVKVTVKNSSQKTTGLSVKVKGTTIKGKKGSRKAGSASDGTINLTMGATAQITVTPSPATTSQAISYSVEGLNGYVKVSSSGLITAKNTKLARGMKTGYGIVIVKSGDYTVRIGVKTKK